MLYAVHGHYEGSLVHTLLYDISGVSSPIAFHASLPVGELWTLAGSLASCSPTNISGYSNHVCTYIHTKMTAFCAWTIWHLP